MENSDFAKLKDNNPFKEKCEAAEEALNEGHELESIMMMGIVLEKLTKDLIKHSEIKISDSDYLTQNERIIKLKNNNIINNNLSNDFHKSKLIRNNILYGVINENYSHYAYLMKNHFLKIMVWYDENYVPEENKKFNFKINALRGNKKMTEYDLSNIKDNNPYKEKCEEVEEKLNNGDFYGGSAIMAISLEKLTKDLIKHSKIKTLDIDYLSQKERIYELKNNNIINNNLSEDFKQANKLRNRILHGDKNGNPYPDSVLYYYTSLMENHFLRIMVWYDVNYVPLEINPIFKLKQYLNKICDDSSIINIIKLEIEEGKITENHQITKRIKEELTKYVESLNIELEIKEKIIKEISSGIIRNMSQIDEKTKGQEKDPIIGVANIVNTENMMKYTIQSTDIDKELKENMNKLENNTHENKQLQEDYNKYGSSSFTTETVTICKNQAQSQMVKEDEIIFNATKSYNYNKVMRPEKPKIGVANIVNTENMMKYTIQSTDIDKELKENMNKLENNTHENKQLQEDYNKYGSSSFTTETVTICKNQAQSKLVEKDEIIFNATKSYNYISKKEKESEDICEPNIANAENNNESTLQSADIDKELKENKENMENKEDEIISDINKSDKPNNQSNGFGNRIRKIFKK